MQNKIALVFGYNQYGFEIAQNLKDTYEHVQVYTQNKEETQSEEFDVKLFDLSDNWSDLEKSVDIENSIVFCSLEDSAENIFLTISLRAYFSELSIIAIASNNENAHKLKMAGANKVIPVVETTADIITNILELPVSNKVLQSILFEKTDLKIAQVKITSDCTIKDEEIQSIEWSRYQGIIVVSLMHKDMHNEFIYSSKVKHHILQDGDTLIVVGYEKDLEDFKVLIGSKS